jgi:hypothetical protein
MLSCAITTTFRVVVATRLGTFAIWTAPSQRTTVIIAASKLLKLDRVLILEKGPKGS